MDWNNKFSSLVKDTESNLAKVKEQLNYNVGGSGSPLMNTSNFNSGLQSPIYSHYYNNAPSSPKPTALSSSTFVPYYRSNTKKYDMLDTQSSQMPSFLSGGDTGSHDLGSSSGMVTLLHDKIDAQSKTIEALLNTVKRQEEERNTYSSQVKELRDDIAQLNHRIAERGVDLQTERKMEQWKHDITSQISELRSQLRTTQRESSERYRHLHADNPTHGTIKDLNDLKMCITRECDGLKYSIESVKKRISNLEHDIHSNTGASRVNYGISKPLKMELINNRRPQENIGMSQLRNSIDTIRHQLVGMESDIKKTNSLIIPEYTKKRVKNQMYKHSVKQYTPPVNDLDISADLSDDNDDDSISLGLDEETKQDNLFSYNTKQSNGLGRASKKSPSIDPLDGDLSLDELEDPNYDDLDDVKTADLDDVMTANTLDLDLTDDEDIENDHELSIDELN